MATRYAIEQQRPAGVGSVFRWYVKELGVLGADQMPNIVAVCYSEADARLIVLALEEYWDRRARRANDLTRDE